jgi:hypothetical protein
MGRFSPEALIWTYSFPFIQKARYLPLGEIAADPKGLSHEYEVSGFTEISLDFSGGFSG